MGPAIDALRPALRVTGRNPTFLVAALLTLVGSGLASIAVGRIPVVGEIVNSVLVTPAISALLLGMAAAGLATDAATLGDGVETLRASYRSLVVAYAVLFAGVLLVVVGWSLEVAVVFLLGSGTDAAADLVGSRPTSLRAATDPAAAGATPMAMTPETAAPILLITLLALGIALVGGLAVQFFDVAIVVGGESALSSFGTSYRLFRDAPASVLGYSVLRMLPVVGAGLVVAGAWVAGGALAGTVGGVLLVLLAAVLVGPITFAFITSYHVAYYDERVRDGRGGGPTPDRTPTNRAADVD